jgi:N-acylneuraminate cytidylyltransferase
VNPSNIIAIIPARGGSKRIPNKNLLRIAGQPLVFHSIRHALSARYVSKVYVTTDSPEILRVSAAAGAEVIERPMEISGDQASSESAILHALEEHIRRSASEPDLIVFLQATSPVRRFNDIDQAVQTLIENDLDSLFSACENKRLIWAERASGELYSLNYDYHQRKSEQDMAIQWRENGSIYVFKPAILHTHNNRLGGRMGVYEMDYWSSFQIDDPAHIEIIEWIMGRPEYAPPVDWPERIGLVVFDFDGVMTDNTVHTSQEGIESVRVHRGDGWGIARLKEAGVPMMILSTEANPVVAARARKLKLDCHQNIGNKAAYLKDYATRQGIDLSRVAYLGNDINDLEAMLLVGLPVAVVDAHPKIRALARLQLTRAGGEGAVREFCERLLDAYSETDQR